MNHKNSAHTAEHGRRWFSRRRVSVLIGVVAVIAAVAWVRASNGADAAGLLARAGIESPTITVHKGPACDCCDEWIEHLRKHGFAVQVVEQPDVAPVRYRLGVPDDAASCHTATVGRYVVEGHVPASDIARLLVERPNVRGIAAPGMPNGSPGMENGLKDAYTVVTFDQGEIKSAFASH